MDVFTFEAMRLPFSTQFSCHQFSCHNLRRYFFTNHSFSRRLKAIFHKAVCAAALAVAVPADATWQPAHGPLLTRWAKDVSPKNAHREYPRPQMVRKDWQNLNGLWDYALTARDAPPPAKWDGQILVPFPIESALSGVMQRVYETNRLWYHRTFRIPREWKGRNILLNFGAVDWEAKVSVNGKEVSSHRGGYDGFSFDITDALNPSGEQEIVVMVWDPADAGTQPRGKQVRNPHGIWYTPTSGIWQTVWLEPVAADHFLSVDITPYLDDSVVSCVTRVACDAGGWRTIEGEVLDGNTVVTRGLWRANVHERNPKTGWTNAWRERIAMVITNATPWSPESPFLYQVKFTLTDESVVSPKKSRKVLDEIVCYFGMRKISLGKDEHGNLRLCLNNKPYFMFGPLDQGFWPDGLYTAPTDEALRYDIEMTKKLGFNLARKHVKVEPDRWYYWCDKLGLLVWQDMPSGDRYIKPNEPDIQRSAESAEQFETELRALLAGRGNHPCIVMWVPFNEGWGQYDTQRIAKWIKDNDPSRLVNNTSGWSDRGVGDVNDLHKYPGPGSPAPEANRAAVLGEFGGLGLPVKGHTWQAEKNWGYRSFTNAAALTTAYVGLVEQLPGLVASNGLSAAVYTQTTDVEVEVNGLMTYDRAVVKMDAKRIAEANEKLYRPLSKNTSRQLPRISR
jgi:hypothetical protein